MASLRDRFSVDLSRPSDGLVVYGDLTTGFVGHPVEGGYGISPTPAESYANPRTLFVADFIGAMNLLPGSISDHTLSVGGHKLSADTLPSNAEVKVAIRPEDMTPLTTPHPSAWQGHIEQISDLGHYRRALVEVNDAAMEPLKVYMPKAMDFAEGEALHVLPRRLLVYIGDNPPVELTQPTPVGVTVG